MQLTDWPSQERYWQWTIAGDSLVFCDLSRPGHRVLLAQPIAGGSPTIMGYADGIDDYSLLAADPATGEATYSRVLRDDPDIGWLRLERH